MEDYPKTLMELEKRFSTEEAYLEYLFGKERKGVSLLTLDKYKIWPKHHTVCRCSPTGKQLPVLPAAELESSNGKITMNRKGEKIGWIGGWSGGFIWLCVLSIVWLIQAKLRNGILGVSLFIIAILFIFNFAPWKFPKTKYWKLMLPMYAVFFISIVLCVYLLGGVKSVGLNWFSFFWIIPCLIPFATVGSRSWNNNSA